MNINNEWQYMISVRHDDTFFLSYSHFEIFQICCIIESGLKNILQGKGSVSFGEPIQTSANYLRNSAKTSAMAKEVSQVKSKKQGT